MLSLWSSVGDGAAVAVAYEPPGSGAKLRDVAGNAVAGFAYTRAQNRTEVSRPGFRSASADGSTLTVTFSEPLDEDSVPAGSTFTVTAAPAEGAARSIAGAGTTSVDGATVSVSLAAAVVHGEVLTVAYAPSGIRSIRDLAGKWARRFVGKAATNHTPDTSKPTLASASVDGPTLTLTFNEALATGGSAPAAGAFSVAGAAAATSVTSVSFHGTDATKVELTLNPAVEHGESGLTVDYAKPEANPLADASANEVDDLTSQPVTNDTPVPAQAALVSNPGDDATYAAGDRIEVRITFDEAVAVDTEAGAPRLRLDLDPADDGEDSGKRWAAYDGGTGTNELTFAWAVPSGDMSTGGVAVLANTLEVNGGTIKSVATQADAALGHAGLAHDPAHKVDAAPPRLLRGEIDGATMTLHFSEALDPESTGGRFLMGIQTSETKSLGCYARGEVSVDGATATVGLGEGCPPARAGLTERNTLIYLRRADGGDGAFRDLAGNLLAPDGDAGVGLYVHIKLENVTGTAPAVTAPAVTAVAVVSDAGSDATYALGDIIRVAVTFDVPVDVTGTPRLRIDMDPAHWGEKWAVYERGSGASSLTFAHEVVEPNLSTLGIAVLANTLELDGGTIRSGGADASLAHDGLAHDANHKVDWRTQPESDSGDGGESPGSVSGDDGPPAVTGVSVISSPASGDTYRLGESIRVRVTFDRAVAVTGSPVLGIDMDPAHWGTKQAAYESGGTSSLTFAHEVVEPNYSTQGIAVLANTLALNGGTIRAAGGTNAALGHTGLAHDSGHKVDWRPDISVADAQAHEGTGASVAFVVSLSRAFTGSEHRVTVDYATSNGTATAGADYLATSGTLTFAVGEQTKTVNVPVLDDSHDEGEETFRLRLSNATGARIGAGEATGTIVNTDPMPRAWLARFGRTVAEQVVAGVQARLEAPRSGGAHARIAGQGFAAGSGLDAYGAARRTDQELARWLAGTPEQPRTMTGGELLAVSTFAVTSTAAEDGASAALWGRGGWSQWDGREESLSVDGEVTSALLGAEVASGAWLGGVMLAHARGDGSYRDAAGAGTVTSALTAVHPYVGVDLSERLTAWAAGGLGLGGLTVTPEGAGALETDLALVLAALGARGRLVEPAAGSGFSLAIETDAYWVRTSSAAAAELAEMHADATRIRLGLDVGYRLGLGGGGALAPTVEIGVRHDGGHAETGYGMDLGGGLAWSDPALGLSAQVAARALLTGAFDGFRDLGLSGSLAWDPDPASDRGPSLSLTQTLGAQASGGANGLLGRQTLADLAASDNGFENRNLELRLGYGFPAFGDRFTSTPELAFGLSPESREYRVGWRLTSAVRGAPGFEVSLDATRREYANEDGPEHGVMLRGAIRW